MKKMVQFFALAMLFAMTGTSFIVEAKGNDCAYSTHKACNNHKGSCHWNGKCRKGSDTSSNTSTTAATDVPLIMGGNSNTIAKVTKASTLQNMTAFQIGYSFFDSAKTYGILQPNDSVNIPGDAQSFSAYTILASTTVTSMIRILNMIIPINTAYIIASASNSNPLSPLFLGTIDDCLTAGICQPAQKVDPTQAYSNSIPAN